MRNHTQIQGRDTALPGEPIRKRAVVTDDGTDVALVLLDAAQPAEIGTRFLHHGRMWEIRGSRRGSRVLVAEPLEALG